MTVDTSTHRDWYERQWPRLSAGGVWLRGGELGAVPPARWDECGYHVLVSRLSTYRDTAVSTTHLLLHALLAGLEGVYPDLAWLPPPRDGELMAQDGVPWLLGSQTKRGARAFDCVAVSLSVPQETFNLAAMLLRSGIATDRRERLADATAPLVIAGGASVGAAAALYGEQSGVDGLFVGDSLEVIGELFRRCRDGRANGLAKPEVLESLRDLDGFVLPGAPVRPRSATAAGAASGAWTPLPAAAAMPVSYDPSRTGIVTVPITEGCRWKCSFCYESWLHPRYRSLAGAEVDARAGELKAWAGAHRAELFSFNFDMHEDLPGIVDRLSARFDRLGLKSQRFDRLAETPRMLELMHAVGKTSLTCGMEGISDRLRGYLNKRLDDARLRRALAAIAAAPLRQVKVFLIATGREQDDDYAEFAATLAWFRDELAGQGRRPRVIFSVTPLVHFPATPLVFEAPPPPRRVAAAVHRIAVTIRRAGFQVRAAARDPEAVVSQVLVSGRHPDAPAVEPYRPGGDADATWRAVVAAVRAGGHVYYDGITAHCRDDFLAALAGETGMARPAPVAPPVVLVTAEGPVRRVHALSLGALAEAAGPGAGRPAAARDGAPRPTGPARDAAVAAAIPEIRRRVLAARRDRVEVTFLVELGAPAAGLPRGYAAAALARALMLADSALVDTYRGPGASLWGARDVPCRVVGHDRLGLWWTAAGADRVAARWRDDAAFGAAVNAGFAPWGTLLPAAAQPLPATRLVLGAPYRPDGAAWLTGCHLRYVQRRLPDGPGYRCELARDSLRKKLVLEYLQREPAAAADGADPRASYTVELVPGERFAVESFCREAFALPAPEEHARVTARAVLFAVDAAS